MAASEVTSQCVIPFISECEVVIVLPCFNLISSCIDVAIPPALYGTVEVFHYDKVAVSYMFVV